MVQEVKASCIKYIQLHIKLYCTCCTTVPLGILRGASGIYRKPQVLQICWLFDSFSD